MTNYHLISIRKNIAVAVVQLFVCIMSMCRQTDLSIIYLYSSRSRDLSQVMTITVGNLRVRILGAFMHYEEFYCPAVEFSMLVCTFFVLNRKKSHSGQYNAF